MPKKATGIAGTTNAMDTNSPKPVHGRRPRSLKMAQIRAIIAVPQRMLNTRESGSHGPITAYVGLSSNGHSKEDVGVENSWADTPHVPLAAKFLATDM